MVTVRALSNLPDAILISRTLVSQIFLCTLLRTIAIIIIFLVSVKLELVWYFSFFCSLTFLSLSENEITSGGVHELAGALQVNQSLQRLK